jgi:hypothetical protein
VSHKYASFTFPPDLTSGSAKKRRLAGDPAQIIAAGEEADRRLWNGNEWSIQSTRPISDDELQALLARKGVRPLVGIPRPKRLFAVVCAKFNRETRAMDREIHSVDKRTWNRLIDDAYLGRFVFYSPLARSHDKPVYRDVINASASLAGGA